MPCSRRLTSSRRDGVNTQTENALGTTGAIRPCTIWNLRLNYAPPKARWAVFAGVRNLSDRSFRRATTTGSFIGIQPGEIRNFYGGVSWRFLASRGGASGDSLSKEC
ncbi:MAG: TonB-dependent receptor [Nitrospira sp.]|nr:TonB-dependent receptor [Nitrospira sp.]